MPDLKTVADIKSSILRPSLTSLFEVQFALPSAGQTGSSAFQEFLKADGVTWPTSQGTLNLLCSEASLPGSSVALFELNNDRTGVTERHAHRRVFDDRIDFTFYVDVEQYLPIMFFESWIRFITGSSTETDLKAKEYHYRMNYPDEYTADQGLKVIKFEKDYKRQKGRKPISFPATGQTLEYEFFRTFPIAVNSMPVSYDAANLLKCTVSMSYIRYEVKRINSSSSTTTESKTTPSRIQNIQNITNITDEYYNNFGDNLQNATNSADFVDGSNQGRGNRGRIFGESIG